MASSPSRDRGPLSVGEAEAQSVFFSNDFQRQDDHLSLEAAITFKAPPVGVPADAHICRVCDAIAEVAGASPATTVSCGAFETGLFVDRGVQAVTYAPSAEGCTHAPDECTIGGDLDVTA